MSLRLLFVADAAVGMAFGIGLLFAPAAVGTLFGIQLEPGAIFVTRLFGTFVVGLSLMLWGARDAVASAAGIAMTRGQAVADVAATILCIAATLQGTVNWLGWALVAMFACFGAARIWYGYLRPVKGGILQA